MHLITRGHFRSRDKDSGQNIRSAISKNPMLHADFMALRFIEPELLPIEVIQCGLFFAPVTLTLPNDLHIWIWPVFPGDIHGSANMNFLREGFRKLSSDRQTDRQTRPKLYTTPLCEWSKMWQLWCIATWGSPTSHQSFCDLIARPTPSLKSVDLSVHDLQRSTSSVLTADNLCYTVTLTFDWPWPFAVYRLWREFGTVCGSSMPI